MSWFRPARGCNAEGSKAPGVFMKEPTSSLLTLSKLTVPAGSWRVASALLEGDADCVCFLPVKTSQTPILLDSTARGGGVKIGGKVMMSALQRRLFSRGCRLRDGAGQVCRADLTSSEVHRLLFDSHPSTTCTSLRIRCQCRVNGCSSRWHFSY